ncbi:MAG: hypothetical protein ACI4FY_06875 [Acetatifactor sp.]
MDWKQILDAADEDYLIGISNKGIVKRAYKDKEEAGIAPKILPSSEGDKLVISLGEEEVTLCYPLGESKCSCPSRSICRHVVQAILSAREQIETLGGEADRKQQGIPDEELAHKLQEVPASTPSGGLREEILAYPVKKLFRTLGSSGLRELAEHMEREELPDIQQTSIVTVKLPEKEIVVKLLSPLEYSSCTCHKKELCSHKAEAILWCQWQEKQLTLKEIREELEQAPEFDREQLGEAACQIKSFLDELLQMGLCRTSADAVHTLERLAILAHNALLPQIENSLRALAEVYGKYLRRSAGFSVTDALSRLVGLYDRILRLMEACDNSEIGRLAGEFHARYKPVGVLDLVGITMEHFVSQSGYEGDTVYFLEENTGMWYTYTNARPTFYEGKRRSTFSEKAQAPWEMSVSLEDLVCLKIHLEGVKADETGRLSSSKETRGEVASSRCLTEKLLEKWYYRDFGDAFREQIAIEDETQSGTKLKHPVFLQPARIESGVFDEVEQVLRLPLYDEKGREVLVEVPYSKREKDTIRYLERLKEDPPPCFVGRLYLSEGRLKLYPLDLFGRKELPWSCPKETNRGFFRRKEEIREEKEPATDAWDPVTEILTQTEVVLEDLYQVGFDTVQDHLLHSLKELGESAESLGMEHLSKQLFRLRKQMDGTRHCIERQGDTKDDMLRQYVILWQYILIGKKKVLYDRARVKYDNGDRREI